LSTRTALVVGAGIGGLATGISLRRAGWKPMIFERAENPRELGFALNLAPNAMAALDELGLAERLQREGEITKEVEVRAGDGRVLRRIEVARWQEEHDAGKRERGSRRSWLPVIALRPALYGALLQTVNREDLLLGAEAVGFEQDAKGIALTLADGRAFAGDVLIAADGVHSRIREQLHPRERPLRASGYHAVRGVAYGVAHHLGGLTAVGYLGDGYESAAVVAGQGAVYWYVSLQSREVRGRDADVEAVLAEWTPRLDAPLRAIIEATKPEDRRLDELFDRDPAKVWGRGRVTLLGDAAHPMLPHTGQGAAQALEDAVGLGLALKKEAVVETALRAYERVRSARTRPIVAMGRRIPRTTTTRNRVLHYLRELVLRKAPSKMLLQGIYLGGTDDVQTELR
jgi:2-polyprenyl-6-methoxyphenol hydroxylase-like FAD-dependent oxidoreductase